ncbi:hypothetical protein EVAR_20751_1 [Eumeta japonica]|uniref:Uncharacterized protein n=1 Tax=Eumeta variegata TaxID=151549 RepID=A0A4C1V913_EUMVA|nr:hypothetical protein EVAR_20751_1 [Eumeta japonica]
MRVMERSVRITLENSMRHGWRRASTKCVGATKRRAETHLRLSTRVGRTSRSVQSTALARPHTIDLVAGLAVDHLACDPRHPDKSRYVRMLFVVD